MKSILSMPSISQSAPSAKSADKNLLALAEAARQLAVESKRLTAAIDEANRLLRAQQQRADEGEAWKGQ